MQFYFLADEVAILDGICDATFDFLEAFEGRVVNTKVHQGLWLYVWVQTAGSLRSYMLMMLHLWEAGGHACFLYILEYVQLRFHVTINGNFRRAKVAICSELSRAEGLLLPSLSWSMWHFSRHLLVTYYEILLILTVIEGTVCSSICISIWWMVGTGEKLPKYTHAAAAPTWLARAVPD